MTKWIEAYLAKQWYQQYLPYSNPDSPYHYMYQRRVNRWTGLLLSIILTYAAYDLIDWRTHGRDIGAWIFFSAIGCVVTFLAVYALANVAMWLISWLKGE